MMALCGEVELYKKYVTFCDKSDLIRTLGKTSKIGYCLMSMPVISNREVYFYGEG
jgi:hypothetical protein